MTARVQVEYGTDKITSDAHFVMYPPHAKRDGTEPVIVWCHGSGPNWNESFYPFDAINDWSSRFMEVAEAGYIMICTPHFDEAIGDPNDTWGNNNSTTDLDNAVAYARRAVTDVNGGAGGHPTNKVILIGTSMGFLTAANYYRRFPTKVAGIIGIHPVVDLDYTYQNGWEAEIENAFGFNGPPIDGTVNSTYNPTATPSAFNIPTLLITNSDDTTTGQSGTNKVTNYNAAVNALTSPNGDSTLVVSGTGGHLVPTFSSGNIISWIRTFGLSGFPRRVWS